MGCVLCRRDNADLGAYCQACGQFIAESIGQLGSFDEPIQWGTTRISPMVRHLAPTCYLCRDAPTEHAEHVIPKAAGGSDTLGGACAPCNLSKGDSILKPSREQQQRLADQQYAIRSALDAIAADPVPFWLGFIEEDIDLAVGDLIEDFGDDSDIVDRSDALDYFIKDSPQALSTLLDAAVDIVLARFREQVS